MERIGAVDASELHHLLGTLPWQPAGDPGTWAMLEEKQFPTPVAEAVKRLIAHVPNDMWPGRARGMTCLSRLVPGQYLPQHADHHDGHCDIRVHIPITTNPGVAFVSGIKAVNMKQGEVWVINPGVTHCVANAGDTDRVHLFWNMRL